jgi:dsRNA-specific ribonuclease
MQPNQQVAVMERIIGYTFNDRQLAVEALYHGGSPIDFDGACITPQRNKRLAIMGDNMLDMLLIRKWFNTQDRFGKTSPRGPYPHQDLLTRCRPSSLRDGMD